MLNPSAKRLAFLPAMAAAFSLSVIAAASPTPEMVLEIKEEVLDPGLETRLGLLADDYVQGRFSGDLVRKMDAVSGSLGDEPQPLDAYADVSRKRFLVHRIDHVREGDQELLIVVGQIASPEYGCLVWRRAAVAAALVDGQWHVTNVLAQLQVTHRPRPACAPGVFHHGAPPN